MQRTITINGGARPYTKQYYISVYRFREVSSAWKLAVDCTPGLWAAISSDCHPKVLSNALLRSAKAPLYPTLNLTFDEATGAQSQAMADMCSTFLAQVGPEISRWRSVLFYLPGTSRAMVEEHLTKPAPLAENVGISVWTRMKGEGTVDLFNGQADRLKVLALQSFPMRWESPILRGVEKLKIGGWGLALRLSQLLAILSDSTRLKKLFLSTPEIQLDVLNPLDHKIPLGLLEELHLETPQLPGKVANILLKSIDIPVCRNLHLDIDMDNFEGPQLLSETMLQFRSRICESIIRSSKSEVQTSGRILHHPWNIPGEGTPIAPKFHFLFSDCSTESMWSWIEEVHLGLPTKVDLSTYPLYIEEEIEPLKRMARSPVVGSLHLTEGGTYHTVAFELLSHALPVDAGTGGRKGFPSLTYLSTRYKGNIDIRLKAALEKRYQESVDVSGGHVERPPDLKLNFVTLSGKPDYDNARLFIGMDGIITVEVDGNPILE
ncbi:hypothetical protein FRC00_007910 [Tulasnella sp. 408]|nr:hypothetical protein FRC00_007910 [Tulasnella sp. 408]